MTGIDVILAWSLLGFVIGVITTAVHDGSLTVFDILMCTFTAPLWPIILVVIAIVHTSHIFIWRRK